MRKFGPKAANHPSCGEICPLCEEPLLVGEFTTLLETEPASPEDAEKKAAGRAYTAAAQEVHYNCAKCSAKANEVLTGLAAQLNKNTETLKGMLK